MNLFALNALREVRHYALDFADRVSLNQAIGSSRWRQNRLLILCYHGVSLVDEHEWSDLYVSPEHLAHRLQLLKKTGATVLPLEEALTLSRQGLLPKKAVSLTFDDGAYDFTAKAVPILEAHGVHATLYLTTYYCGRRQPVFDTAASYLLWKGRGKSIMVPGINRSVTVPENTSSPSFATLHNEIRQFAIDSGLNSDEKNELARSLAQAVHVDFDAMLAQRLFQLMSFEEIQALSPQRVSIQLHTHRHRTPRSKVAFQREIEENARIISALRGRAEALNHFCYPSGDHVPEYAAWLRELQVEWATTCDPGLVSQTDDPYFLPRVIDTETMTQSTFLAWVSGLGMMAFTRRKTTPVRLRREP